MARSVSLGQLKADIRDQGDVAGATSRVTGTLLTRQINQAIQRFRSRLSTEGETHYLVSTTGSLTVGATSPYPFHVLDLSAASPSIVRVYGVDIVVDDVHYSLKHVPFRSRTDYGVHTARPCAWANFRTRELAILPPPDGAYTYVAWYLPVLTDLADDDDTFDGVEGWEEAITWEVVARLTVRDNNTGAHAISVQFRDSIWRDILSSARRVSSEGGARVGRDTMAETLYGGGRGHRRLPPP